MTGMIFYVGCNYKRFLEESEAADNAACCDFFEGQFTYKDYTGKGD